MHIIQSPAEKRRVLFFPFLKAEPRVHDGDEAPCAARRAPRLLTVNLN
jgi:hypothetical protein